ncbi:MAG TPA: hypothetical protein VMK12_01510, partial [Anaeromyxobacteraceae bacterium]|nr:hypothetical protein [Anaeromyxobacteraceae bacterium]
ATARLGPNRLERALPYQAQFEFTHAALEAQQKPIVTKPWVVDPVRIDYECAHQTAKVYQMMPVSAIASEARRFKG